MSEEQAMPTAPGIPPEPAAGEAGRWLKVYLQPTPELISWLRRLCPGKVAAHAEE